MGERLIHERDPINGCQRSRILSSQAGIRDSGQTEFEQVPHWRELDCVEDLRHWLGAGSRRKGAAS